MFPRRVVVTGVGAVTPLGDSVSSSWKNLLLGLNGIKNILSLPDWDHLHSSLKNLSSHLGGPVWSIPPKSPLISLKLPRSFLFAEIAAREALIDSNFPGEFLENVGVFFGCGLPGVSEVYDNSELISSGVF